MVCIEPEDIIVDSGKHISISQLPVLTGKEFCIIANHILKRIFG
ncbi:hypothetical protein HMPREF3293_00412 [Christensenella minuta]|uniref:Uncharacterized protein n=1 Tax=Christensenella minuta TaxID=626937 RepID=A0A136Q7R2_9FIRM|nr:hypothetical protein HMPREF3293_00412 [Christensenella minuta]